MARLPIKPPIKVGASKVSSYVPTGRPRGRPPKVAAVEIHESSKDAPVANPPKAPKTNTVIPQTRSEPAPQRGDKPALHGTLSLLGMVLAGLRSHHIGPIDVAYIHYIYDFILDMQKYGINPPVMQLDRVRGMAVQNRWKEAGAALKDFSDSFSVQLRKLILKDSSVKAETVSLLNTFLDMTAARNPDSWGKMETTALNKLKYLNNETLNQLWRVHLDSDQSDEMDSLKGIVSQVRGREYTGDDVRMAYLLTYPERVKLRESDPELNKKYNAAANSAIKKYRSALRNWVLDKGNKPQPIAKARTVMEAQGFLLHELPSELDSLFIGSDGFYYTAEGLKVTNRPQPGAIIGKLNTAYNPERNDSGDNWIFQYRVDDDEADWSYAYTENFKRVSKDEKSDTILEYIEAVPAMRPKWINDLKGADHDRKVLALITDLLYHFAARIGGEGNVTRGVGNTYGISTLRVKHIKKVGSAIKLDYLGKKGQHQVHTINPGDIDEKRYIPIIERLMQGKGKEDNLFTFVDGKPVTANDVRAYFRQLKIPVTPHYLRGIRGSALMLDILEKPDVKKRVFEQAEAERFFKKEALKVGSLLGHFNKGEATAATSINSYIAVELTQGWFKGKNLRVPLWAKLGAKED